MFRCPNERTRLCGATLSHALTSISGLLLLLYKQHSQVPPLTGIIAGIFRTIRLIPKWRKIHYSFVSMLIGPCCLILSQIFLRILQMGSRQQGPNNSDTKEQCIFRHLGIRCIYFKCRCYHELNLLRDTSADIFAFFVYFLFTPFSFVFKLLFFAAFHPKLKRGLLKTSRDALADGCPLEI